MKTLVRILAMFFSLYCVFASLVGCKIIKPQLEEPPKECEHSFGDWTPYATNPVLHCQERIYLRSCTLCGTSDQKYGSMLDHEFGESVTLPPTCDKAGYDVCKCIYCGMEIKENKTDPTGEHNIKSIVSEANCGYEGYAYDVCADCDYVAIRTLPIVGEHTFNENGVCTVCGRRKSE